MKRVHLFVTGKVQGVWFRESMKKEAEAYGALGMTRNLVDGRVEAILEGHNAAVDRVVAWCHHGPPAAVVEKVEATEEPPKGEFSAFRVER